MGGEGWGRGLNPIRLVSLKEVERNREEEDGHVTMETATEMP